MIKHKIKKIIFVIFVILISSYRLSLLDRGAISFPDEQRYFNSVSALSCLFNIDLKGFCSFISNTNARPGDAILRCIPACGQQILEKYFTIGPNNPQSLLIPTIFNIIISIFILVFFFKISLLIFNNSFVTSFISTVIYSLFVNSNIYIRHVLPYDLALLSFIIVIYYILKKIKRKEIFFFKNIIIIGILLGLSYTIYPGYYFVPIYIFFFLLLLKKKDFYKNRKISSLFILVASVIVVLLFFEGIARIGGSSYFNSMLSLSDTVTQGSFEEGYVFFPKYLINVENVIGIIILFFTILFLIKEFYFFIKKGTKNLFEDKFKLFILISFMFIFFHGTLSTVFHKMVFYGRLIHIFYPFIIWCAISFIFELNYKIPKKIILISLICASFFSFIKFSNVYLNLAYPRDVLFNNKIKIIDINSTNLINESPFYVEIKTPSDFYYSGKFSKMNIRTENDFVLLNICYFYPVSEIYKKYKPKINQNLVFEAKHFLTFTAYGFEGFSIKDRELLKNRNYQIKIYKSGN